MNKHVVRLIRELQEARENFPHSESESEEDSDDPDVSEGTENRRSRKRDEYATADLVESMEEKLEFAQADQKNLFLIIFQV